MNSFPETNDSPRSLADFGLVAPLTPRLDPSKRLDFFENAPAGTIITMWGDLYKKSHHGNWFALEDIVPDDNFDYTEYTWNEHQPEPMAKEMTGDATEIYVLRFGESYNYSVD